MNPPNSETDISSRLRAIGLAQYIALFRDHDIDLDTFLMLSPEDLIEIGVISFGHRKRIIAEIKSLKEAVGRRVSEDIGWQNRLCAVVFCDISSYSVMSRTLDVEDLKTLENRFVDVMGTIIATAGGVISDTQGDAIIGMFGYPRAHEDDALRACAAAIDMHISASQLSAEFASSIGLTLPFEVHIGVAFGEVILADEEPDPESGIFRMTGSAVSLASRLSDAATNGETLITREIYELLDGKAECIDNGRLVLQGQAEPVQSYQLTELNFSNTPPTDRPFVGRTAERETFLRALRHTTNERCLSSLIVVGEPGIGKSRFTGEICREARETGATLIDVQIIEFGGFAQRALTHEIVWQGLGLPYSATPDQRRAQCETFLNNHSEFHVRRTFIEKALGLDLSLEADAKLSAMAQRDIVDQETMLAQMILRLCAAETPLVCRIEDIQWARPADLDFIETLLEQIDDEPILFVLTARNHGTGLPPRVRKLAEVAKHEVIELAPLQSHELRQLGAALGVSDAAQFQTLTEKSNGNPLFLEQLILYGNGDEPARDGNSSVPYRIQNLAQARMDRLSSVDRAALQVCAVFGDRFAPEAVRAVIGDPDYGFQALLEQNFLQQREQQYAFRHSLLREGVYDGLLRSRRRTLHNQIAGWFETRDLALKAEHLQKADGNGNAAEAFLRAAEASAYGYNFPEALDLIDRGLSCPANDRVRFDLLFMKGELLSSSYRYNEANESLHRALKSLEDPYLRLQVLLRLANNFDYLDQREEAARRLDEAEAIAAGIGTDKDIAEIAVIRGKIEHVLGNGGSYLSYSMRARDLAYRSQSHETIIEALSVLGMAQFVAGELKAGRETFVEALEFARRHGRDHAVIEGSHMRAWYNVLALEFEEAYAIGAEVKETARRIHNQRAMMNGARMQFYACFERGLLEEAEEHLNLCLEICRTISARRFQPVVHGFLARVASLRGDQETARQHLGRATNLMRGLERWVGPMVYGCVTHVSEDRGEIDWALAGGIEILNNGCGFHNYYYFLRDAIDASLIRGDWEGARNYAGRLAAYDGDTMMRWTELQQHKVALITSFAPNAGPKSKKVREYREVLAGAGFSLEANFVDRVVALHG